MKINIREYYDRERLYPKEYIIRELKKGPRELRHYISKLPDIPCINDKGVENICTRIPEVIYVYLIGRY